MKLFRSTILQTLAVLFVALLVATAANASSGDTSTVSAPSTSTSTTPTPTAPPSNSSSTSTDTSTSAPTTTTTTVPTAPTTTTTTTTPTTPDTPDAPDVPDVVTCEDTPNAAACIPDDADVPPTDGDGTPDRELPFTGPGDVFVAMLIALLAGLGGMMLVLAAGSRESIEALSARGMGSATGFRVAYRELLKREIGRDDVT